MKAGTLAAIAGGAILVVGSAALVASQFLPRTKPEPVEIELSQLSSLDPVPGAITVRGTAHYRGVVIQNLPPSLAGGPERYYVFGLFPTHDTSSKEIKLLVRSPFEVERRVDYEFVELTGWLERPKAHTVPARTEQMFARADYFFTDDLYVLEPWEVSTFDPVREAVPKKPAGASGADDGPERAPGGADDGPERAPGGAGDGSERAAEGAGDGSERAPEGAGDGSEQAPEGSDGGGSEQAPEGSDGGGSEP